MKFLTPTSPLVHLTYYCEPILYILDPSNELTLFPQNPYLHVARHFHMLNNCCVNEYIQDATMIDVIALDIRAPAPS